MEVIRCSSNNEESLKRNINSCVVVEKFVGHLTNNKETGPNLGAQHVADGVVDATLSFTQRALEVLKIAQDALRVKVPNSKFQAIPSTIAKAQAGLWRLCFTHNKCPYAFVCISDRATIHFDDESVFPNDVATPNDLKLELSSSKVSAVELTRGDVVLFLNNDDEGRVPFMLEHGLVQTVGFSEKPLGATWWKERMNDKLIKKMDCAKYLNGTCNIGQYHPSHTAQAFQVGNFAAMPWLAEEQQEQEEKQVQSEPEMVLDADGNLVPAATPVAEAVAPQPPPAAPKKASKKPSPAGGGGGITLELLRSRFAALDKRMFKKDFGQRLEKDDLDKRALNLLDKQITTAEQETKPAFDALMQQLTQSKAKVQSFREASFNAALKKKRDSLLKQLAHYLDEDVFEFTKKKESVEKLCGEVTKMEQELIEREKRSNANVAKAVGAEKRATVAASLTLTIPEEVSKENERDEIYIKPNEDDILSGTNDEAMRINELIVERAKTLLQCVRRVGELKLPDEKLKKHVQDAVAIYKGITSSAPGTSINFAEANAYIKMFQSIVDGFVATTTTSDSNSNKKQKTVAATVTAKLICKKVGDDKKKPWGQGCKKNCTKEGYFFETQCRECTDRNVRALTTCMRDNRERFEQVDPKEAERCYALLDDECGQLVAQENVSETEILKQLAHVVWNAYEIFFKTLKIGPAAQQPKEKEEAPAKTKNIKLVNKRVADDDDDDDDDEEDGESIHSEDSSEDGDEEEDEDDGDGFIVPDDEEEEEEGGVAIATPGGAEDEEEGVVLGDDNGDDNDDEQDGGVKIKGKRPRPSSSLKAKQQVSPVKKTKASQRNVADEVVRTIHKFRDMHAVAVKLSQLYVTNAPTSTTDLEQELHRLADIHEVWGIEMAIGGTSTVVRHPGQWFTREEAQEQVMKLSKQAGSTTFDVIKIRLE